MPYEVIFFRDLHIEFLHPIRKAEENLECVPWYLPQVSENMHIPSGISFAGKQVEALRPMGCSEVHEASLLAIQLL